MVQVPQMGGVGQDHLLPGVVTGAAPGGRQVPVDQRVVHPGGGQHLGLETGVERGGQERSRHPLQPGRPSSEEPPVHHDATQHWGAPLTAYPETTPFVVSGSEGQIGAGTMGTRVFGHCGDSGTPVTNDEWTMTT